MILCIAILSKVIYHSTSPRTFDPVLYHFNIKITSSLLHDDVSIENNQISKIFSTRG